MNNPYAAQMAELSATFAGTCDRLKRVEDELGWYLGFSPGEASAKALDLEARISDHRTLLGGLAKHIDAATRSLPGLEARGAYGWDPRKWLSREKRAWRQQATQCKTTIASLGILVDDTQRAINADAAQARELQALVARHQGFDEAGVSRQVAGLRADVAAARARLGHVKILHDKVDAALRPHLSELAGLENRATQLAGKQARAKQLDSQLSSAASSYEKAMLHKQCERELGDSSPRRALAAMDGELQSTQRSIEKVTKRIARVRVESARDIRKVVFDGSNLCIVDGVFIGLRALRPAVVALAGRAKVVVVFDASLRSRFKLSDADLRSMFGADVTVHVAPGAADETVLDLADDATSFVVSNDRFADYMDKAAVKGGRVIRHEIVDTRIFVRGGLDVDEQLEPDGKPARSTS